MLLIGTAVAAVILTARDGGRSYSESESTLALACTLPFHAQTLLYLDAQGVTKLNANASECCALCAAAARGRCETWYDKLCERPTATFIPHNNTNRLSLRC